MTTRKRLVYGPAIEARKNHFKFAATESVEIYGVTAPDAIEAPGGLSFGDFVRRPEALPLYGSNSDAAILLLEFQEQFIGPATRRDLARFVKVRHSGKPYGFRYWDRLAGSIWKTYQGILRGKERTAKAHGGEVKRLANAQARAGREAERSALRRLPRNETESAVTEAAKLRRSAEWRNSRADKKSAAAQALTQAAAKLRAQASDLEARAQCLECDPVLNHKRGSRGHGRMALATLSKTNDGS
jgi:hypothetical protein